ncbi:hypothetical protein BC332_23429 [Capsicum chinense]|nr:hypothetical protein BC332_23429 [Capsicum chinense]
MQGLLLRNTPSSEAGEFPSLGSLGANSYSHLKYGGISSNGEDWATEGTGNEVFGSGFSLFLGFLIDRMHHYLRKLIVLRSSAGSSKKEFERLEKEKLQLKEKADKAAEEIKLSQKEISSLTEMLKKVNLQSDEKDKRVETAEAHVAALQKQAADPLLEYDRLSSESSSWFSELRK